MFEEAFDLVAANVRIVQIEGMPSKELADLLLERAGHFEAHQQYKESFRDYISVMGICETLNLQVLGDMAKTSFNRIRDSLQVMGVLVSVKRLLAGDNFESGQLTSLFFSLDSWLCTKNLWPHVNDDLKSCLSDVASASLEHQSPRAALRQRSSRHRMRLVVPGCFRHLSSASAMDSVLKTPLIPRP
ncbi:MAG: hypothetical protein COB66_05035 [Coxiella sp. (in: Bacteria)]|nr:MAG: hypothetical protein COB66_05035 [Coxiella sp. (in: g-proteobacteria)]